jgi:hypothetical protein
MIEHGENNIIRLELQTVPPTLLQIILLIVAVLRQAGPAIIKVIQTELAAFEIDGFECI